MNPNPHRERATRRAAGGFTLIELLAVMVIVSVIILAAVPAIRSVQSTALQTAGRQVANEMQLARQYAITHRTRVRFMIAAGPVYMPEPRSTNLTLGLRGYIICAATNDGNGDLICWVPLQDWRVLPDGVIFSDYNTTNYAPLTLAPAPPNGVHTNVRGYSAANQWKYFNIYGPHRISTFELDSKNNMQSRTSMCAFVEFTPAGNVNPTYVEPGVAGGIRLIQGTMDTIFSNRDGQISTVFTNVNRDGMQTNISGLYTGSTTNDIGVMIVNNSNNWVMIEFDEYGGRVRLRTPESYQP